MLVIKRGPWLVKQDGGCEDGVHDSTVYFQGQVMAFVKTDETMIKYYREQGYTFMEET